MDISKNEKARKSLILRAFAVFCFCICGEEGIRTPGTLLEYIRFPSVPLQPLEHLSVFWNCKSIKINRIIKLKKKNCQVLKKKRHSGVYSKMSHSVAGTRVELVTSGLWIRRSNQLSYPAIFLKRCKDSHFRPFCKHFRLKNSVLFIR